jgi:hypothetical protein
MPALVSLLPLLLMIVALVDLITRPDSEVRHLPKLVWLLVVLFVPLAGSILWFVIGHRYGGTAKGPRNLVHIVGAQRRPAATPAQPRRRSTEEQLADLEREIKYYEAQDRIKHLEEEIKKKRGLGD